MGRGLCIAWTRGELLQNSYHYRDGRTRGVMEEVFRRIPKEEIYAVTGIQFMPIHTLYQLVAAKRDTPQILLAAERLVTMSDLFNYWLTGNAVCEFTNATTTPMVNPGTRLWATELMQRLELPASLPAPMVEPGALIGTLLPGIARSGSLSDTPMIARIAPPGLRCVGNFRARKHCILEHGTWSLWARKWMFRCSVRTLCV